MTTASFYSPVESEPVIDYIPTDYNVVYDFAQEYARAWMLLNPYYAEAYKDTAYYLGNQWSLEQLRYLQDERRNAFTFNKIRRIINAITGYQRRNRYSSKVVDRFGQSEETADQYTRLMQAVMQPEGYRALSRAFLSACITGISWITPWLDYRDDIVNGDIRFHVDDYCDVIWDPFMTRLDLTDCNFIAKRKYLDKTTVKSLCPGHDKLIDAMPFATRDEKFNYQPYSRQWGLQRLLAYNEYYKARWKDHQVMVNRETGEMKKWYGSKADLQQLEIYHPEWTVITRKVRTIDMYVIVENQLLGHYENPWGQNCYPMVPCAVTWEPMYDLWEWKLQGYTRCMRDPQEEYNKRKSQLTDIVQSQVASGWKAKSGSVSNPKALFQTGQGKIIWFNPGYELDDAQRIDPPVIPESLFQLQAEFDRDIQEIVGVNDAMMGTDETDQMAGILQMLKTGAAVTNIGLGFDLLQDTQYHVSKRVLRYIQNWSPSKIRSILKEEPTSEFYDTFYSKWEIDIVPGMMTETQKQAAFQQAWVMRQGGVAIPDDELFKLAPMPISKNLMQVMENQTESAKEQQRIENEDRERVNMLLMSKAWSDTQLGEERKNRIKYDAALAEEKLAQAQGEQAKGVLDLVKAIKELQSVDLNNIQKAVDVVLALQQEQKDETADTVIDQPKVKKGKKPKSKEAETSMEAPALQA